MFIRHTLTVALDIHYTHSNNNISWRMEAYLQTKYITTQKRKLYVDDEY